jgi:short-subunit dehydrogenase
MKKEILIYNLEHNYLISSNNIKGDNMNILITGARSGIGYATALELIKKGHHVYLTVHTDEQLHGLEDKTELQVPNVTCMKLDITDGADREKVKDLDIDVLINNAAIGNGGSIAEASIDRIRENYEVNFFGTIEMTQLYLRRMIERDDGRIIMISSMVAEMPFPWFGIYSSTKAALTNISMALAKELKEVNSKVKIVIIEPGFYRTGFNEVMMDNKYDNEDSIFKDYRKDIYENEQWQVNTLTSENIQSIVNEIVKAVEAKRPKLKYKAPFIQAVMQKGSIMKNQ